MKTKNNIACVGMTHLGLVHAVAFAEKGFVVTCYDADAILISNLEQHQLPIVEPELDALFEKNRDTLHFTSDLQSLSVCELVFVAHDVPTNDAGVSRIDVIEKIFSHIIPVISPTASLVLLSQVSPGFTRKIQFPKLRLFYQVETLIFGRAVQRALYPERYIVGLAQSDAALPELYQALLNTFHCPILKMHYESAELAKIAINLFLVSSVTTSNTLAEICEAIGADWKEIIPALRLDQRIGQYAYLNPGLGLSGGNLERDLASIIQLGEIYNTDTSVVKAWIAHCQQRRDWVFRCLEKHVFPFMPNAKICILGLSYKPNTHSTKNSPSLLLLEKLVGKKVVVHDPVVVLQDDRFLQEKSALEAISGADVVIVMSAWDEYRALNLHSILSIMRSNFVIDPHGVFVQSVDLDVYIRYFTLGQTPIVSPDKEFIDA